jgi:DNA-binding Lrp family transcriptional regulator
MTPAPDNAGRALRVALQRGIPIAERPFAEMGRALGLTEAEVLAGARRLFDEGIARRFGAVFDARSLGYAGTLCAAALPGAEIERAAATLGPHPGVTHCYEREGQPNLWFTFTARADRHARELRALAAGLRPYEVLDLPALRRFKAEVVLDASPGDARPAARALRPADAGVPPPLPEPERAVVRALQGNVPLSATPLADAARRLGREAGDLLDLLTGWRERGLLRRIGMILYHRRAGFTANGMCVWRVPAGDVERAGGAIAAAPEVTHCYERSPQDAFAYNLFAMVHARERAGALALFRALSRRAGLNGGRILLSLREFKKSSPVFYCEDCAATPGET